MFCRKSCKNTSNILRVFNTALVSLSIMITVRIQKNLCFYKKAFIMVFTCIELHIVTESNGVQHSEAHLPGHTKYYHPRMQDNQKVVFP